MSNRRERRRIDKALGVFKAIKNASKEEKAVMLAKLKEVNDAIKKDWTEEQETLRQEEEVQRYAKALQFQIELGKTHEEAEAFLQKERELEESKRAKKKRRND